ncbi:hypothetical protein Ciccas_004821 [Cichlidogyrus casuarinus]|uniref:Uncharacterized protein n=1 Tax=Cichlidogyrus casuarinus TaxID=1844966 RepID=A0ABD2QCR3_9PLAT
MFDGPFEAIREIDKLKQEIGRLNVQCYGYKETLKRYARDRENELAKFDEMAGKVAKIPLMQREFENKMSILELKIQDCKVVVKSFKDKNITLKKELDSLRHSNISKMTDANELIGEINLLREQLEAKSRNIRCLEDQNIERDVIAASQTNKLENQVYSLNRDLFEMRTKLRERDSKLEEAEEEIGKCHQIIRDYEETITLRKELESGDKVDGPVQDLKQQIRGFVSKLNKTLIDNSFREQSLQTSCEIPVAKTIPEDRALDLKVAASLLTNLVNDLNDEVHPLSASQKELSVLLDQEKDDADDSLIGLLRSIPKTPKPVHRRNLYKKKPSHQNLNTTISIPSHLKSLRNQLNQLVATEEEQHSVCQEASMIGDLTMNIQQKSDQSRQMLQTVKELETLFEKRSPSVVAFAAEPTELTCTISKGFTSPTMSDMDEQASVVYEENFDNIPISHSTALCANNSAQFDGKLPANSLEDQLGRLRSELQQLTTESASLQNANLQQQNLLAHTHTAAGLKYPQFANLIGNENTYEQECG